MGFRLRKKLGTGHFYFNLSGNGLSLGIKSLVATYNIPLIGRKPFRSTIGLPGVGLSYVSQHQRPRRRKRVASDHPGFWSAIKSALQRL